MIPPLALPRQRGAVMFTAKLGALAQLGERLHGMQEVRGSIPLGSTTPLSISSLKRNHQSDQCTLKQLMWKCMDLSVNYVMAVTLDVLRAQSQTCCIVI